WASLAQGSERLPYADPAVGAELLRARIEGQPLVNLIVTDDEPEPLGVIAGPAEAIVDLLGKTPIFEFALTDPELRWLILDTHHNVLVLAGDVPPG
ncbi:MAG: hypothetical protein ABWY12_08025, partial [Burkholderiales bacterium]